MAASELINRIILNQSTMNTLTAPALLKVLDSPTFLRNFGSSTFALSSCLTCEFRVCCTVIQTALAEDAA